MKGRAAALAGPCLIAAVVIGAMHAFVFQGRISAQQPDVLAYWLPTYCHLGRSLAGGHVPTWNPFAMGGVPFAADPQSGWMYAPAMALFGALPCSLAVRMLVVLQPVLAGLGMYWFLRAERLPRAAATVGGLALAMVVAGSKLAVFVPFAGSFAWTALLLAACARYLHAERWAARLLWLLATAG